MEQLSSSIIFSELSNDVGPYRHFSARFKGFFFEEWMGCRKETTPDIRLAIGRIESLSRIDVKATYINLILSI